MKIAVVGAGYVGLVSGACLAGFGHEVTCCDFDAAKVESLKRGQIPIYEPGLDDVVRSNMEAGRLKFDTELTEAVAEAEMVLVAVGTPSRRGDGDADLSYIFSAAATVAAALTGFTVVVVKSTVPVGTGDEVEKVIRVTRPDADFAVVSNPEFLREGKAIEDFQRPDRVVIGTDDDRAKAAMRRMYAELTSVPLLFTSRRTAELIKYAANSFLAMKVTFINEIADLCEKVGADVNEVSTGIGLDQRIGSEFLRAGPGYGGSCFPKDTLAFLKTAAQFGSRLRLVEQTIAINEDRKIAMSNKIVAACGGDVLGKTIGILGLTFKADTDDMRDAPSVTIIKSLLSAGAKVRGYDPEGMRSAQALLPTLHLAKDAYDVAQDADALVLLTDWGVFRSLDFARIKKAMNRATLVDLRNFYSREELEEQGFQYFAVGRR